MSRSKATKKSKSSSLDDGAGPTRHANEDDEMLPVEEMDFHMWSELEDDICGATRASKSQPEDKVQNEEDDDLLDGYESDNGDYGPLSDSEDEHQFNKMSHALGGQMFSEGTEPIELRKGIMFKNFREFVWALKDYYI